MNFPILFFQNKENYISGQKYTFKDFMNGKIDEIGNRLPTDHDLTTHLSSICFFNLFSVKIVLK
jgi:glutamate--cysteine ligase